MRVMQRLENCTTSLEERGARIDLVCTTTFLPRLTTDLPSQPRVELKPQTSMGRGGCGEVIFPWPFTLWKSI